MTVDELIERLEKAEGPSRELDWDISQAIGSVTMPLHAVTGHDDGCWVRKINDTIIEIGSHQTSGSSTGDRYLPRYSSSIDAALLLVPDGMIWQVSSSGESLVSKHVDGGWVPVADDYAENLPALALCIAALRARSAGKG